MSELSRGQTPRLSLSTSSEAAASASASSPRTNGESSRASSGTQPTYLEPSSSRATKPPPNPESKSRAISPSGNEGVHEGLSRRKHRSRNSGGFLVNVFPADGTQDGAARHSIHNASTHKGKAKEDGSELRLRKGRTRQPGHQPRASIGNSPLSMEVTNAVAQEDHIIHRTASNHRDRNHGAYPSSGSKTTGANGSARGDLPDFLGIDTDPAQIVNLALNLSENRRRHVSVGRLSPIDYLSTNRRFVSTGQLGPNYPHSPAIGSTGGSLRHLLQQQRGSRNLSPKLSQFERAVPNPPVTTPAENADFIDPTNIPGFGIHVVDQLGFSPSDATLLRAERAKTALELSYEYRRLLQYLPRLYLPQKTRPGTGKVISNTPYDRSALLGRQYNPLQYVRNRIVRGRERQTFDAEAEGWKDVDKVRNWINLVAGRNKDCVSPTEGEVFPLPVFEPTQNLLDQVIPSPSSSLGRPNAASARKLPHTRPVWITTPWDLLADAYWTETGDHRTLIEDRSGQKVYPRLPSEPVQGLQTSRDLSHIPSRRSDSIPRSSRSPEKSKTVVDLYDVSTKERGRRLHRLRDSITSLHEYSSSQDRKSKWPRRLVRSQSSSSSEASLQGSLTRQSHLHGRGESRDRQDSAVLERQVMELLAKEAENKDWQMYDIRHQFERQTKKEIKHGLQIEESPGPVNGSDEIKRVVERNVKDSKDGLRNGIVHPEEEQQHGPEPRISQEGFDTTAPNSPNDKDVVPGIAINLSPPPLRSRSPRKPLPFQHRALNFGHGKAKQDVSRKDFAPAVTSPTVSERVIKIRQDPEIESVATSSDGFLSPKTAESFGKILRHRRSESRSLRVDKEVKESDTKIRNILKGGSKLAGFVGHPVSKVGDLLWRRDDSNHLSSPITSYASDVSDTEEEYVDSDANNIRLTQSVNDLSGSPQEATNGRATKYHIRNLPSFTPQPRREDDDEALHLREHGSDHIGRQQQLVRERGRSRGFDRLAPPNLDITSASRSLSPALTRIDTHETATTDESRRPSNTPSDSSRYPLRRRFSDILGLPGKIGRGGPPVTGLANLDGQPHRSQERLGSERHPRWSIADRGGSAINGTVSQHDITRVHTLLLSSGIKANEIVRRFNEVPKEPSKLSYKLQAVSKTQISRMPRSKEPAFATRLLTRTIDKNNLHLREAADQFSHKTIDSFHEQLKSLDSRISKGLTPLVRAAADDADALSAEVSSSYRLNVKRLNDNIDHILRRKRRRFRWVRNGGYLLLEWLLLGVMWGVWFVVVIVRLVLGVVGGLWRFGRWLIWL
ncbi:hypothetical protein MMC17_002986 [Xylographa soralifera]|nr:hypothetical protein [Xylographa soralifera]